MPPKVKFQKDDIVRAALNVARRGGIDAVTAREVAKELGMSVGPIFTWFDTMEALRAEAYNQPRGRYRAYIARGFAWPIRFWAWASSTLASPGRSRSCTGCCF